MLIRYFVPALLAAGGGLVSLNGCGGSPSAEDAATTPPSDVFIAFERDFQDFHRWESFVIENGPVEDLSHLAGWRAEYLNRRPPAGAATFPLGTIVVKESDGPDPTTRQIFAMVKRGGGYNLSGAADWEWFELVNHADGSVGMLWHGAGPPTGEGYNGNPMGSCNACHGASPTTDFVLSDRLKAMLTPAPAPTTPGVMP